MTYKSPRLIIRYTSMYINVWDIKPEEVSGSNLEMRRATSLSLSVFPMIDKVMKYIFDKASSHSIIKLGKQHYNFHSFSHALLIKL